MMIHPAHALLLSSVRHRELVARAEEFRAAGLAAGQARPRQECRVPTGRTDPRPCRPDPRRSAVRRLGRTWPRFALRGHLSRRRTHHLR